MLLYFDFWHWAGRRTKERALRQMVAVAVLVMGIVVTPAASAERSDEQVGHATPVVIEIPVRAVKAKPTIKADRYLAPQQFNLAGTVEVTGQGEDTVLTLLNNIKLYR